MCFNPRAPCGARLFNFHYKPPPTCFNPRAPCGARHARPPALRSKAEFQSTRPVWGATKRIEKIFPILIVSIHAPRVGRDKEIQKYNPSLDVSIHAPRVGRDNLPAALRMMHTMFQSTRPVWGATLLAVLRDVLERVSIHAPRVGRDWQNEERRIAVCCFNPRAPCGARPSCV